MQGRIQLALPHFEVTRSRPIASACAHFTRGVGPWRIPLLLHLQGAGCPIRSEGSSIAATFGPLFWGRCLMLSLATESGMISGREERLQKRQRARRSFSTHTP
jgi:hypothetical protein